MIIIRTIRTPVRMVMFINNNINKNVEQNNNNDNENDKDNKAHNITCIDLKNKSYIADYMVIASGTSSRHLQALSEILVTQLIGINGALLILNCKALYFSENCCLEYLQILFFV